MPRHRPLTREESELSAKVVECNRREAAAYLADVESRAGDGCRVRTRLVVSPRLASTIDRIAQEEQVELIVITAHGDAGCNVRSEAHTYVLLSLMHISIAVFCSKN